MRFIDLAMDPFWLGVLVTLAVQGGLFIAVAILIGAWIVVAINLG